MPKYVALIKIIEVNESPSGYRGTENKKESRELIDLEVRSNSLEGLKAKLSGHISLVDTE